MDSNAQTKDGSAILYLVFRRREIYLLKTNKNTDST